jgi:hypothetical protein
MKCSGNSFPREVAPGGDPIQVSFPSLPEYDVYLLRSETMFNLFTEESLMIFQIYLLLLFGMNQVKYLLYAGGNIHFLFVLQCDHGCTRKESWFKKAPGFIILSTIYLPVIWKKAPTRKSTS